MDSRLPAEGQDPTRVWPQARVCLLYHQTSFHESSPYWLKPRARRRGKGRVGIRALEDDLDTHGRAVFGRI